MSAIISPGIPGILDREPAVGMFLVAQRDLRDPHFSRSVIYLLEHGPDGSTGLIVNRPSGIKLSDAISGVREQVAARYSLYFGGPVQHNQIIMLIRNASQTRLVQHIVDDIYVSADRNVMNQLLAENKPEDELHFYLGHAGWSAGQLDLELERGSWHVVEEDTQAIFSTDPDTLWDRLIEQLEPDGLYVLDQADRTETSLIAWTPVLSGPALMLPDPT
jgi:putative transcriptional regulator